MRRRASRLTAGVAVAATALGGGAFTAIPASAQSEAAVTMNVALTGEIDSLNPFLAILQTATNFQRIQYEPLVAWGPEDNGEYPAIADSWEPNEDGSVWTYTLADGATWSDGEAITADDVVFTFNSIMENDALSSGAGAYVSSVDAVEALDELTVEISLAGPQAANPGTDVPIVPEHVWSAIDDPAGYANDADTVGSGPFTVKSYSPTSGVVMVSNPEYRHGEAAVDQINFVPYRNMDAAVQALRAGEIDVLSGTTVAQHEALQDVEEITTVEVGGTGFRGVQINPGAIDSDGNPMGDGHPVLEDVRVRQAIVHAIDRNALTERVLQGYGDVGTGLIPPTFPNYAVSPDDDRLIPFDIEAGKALLDEAGLEVGSNGIRLDEDGQEITLRLSSYDHASAQQTIDFLEGWIRELGFNVETAVTSMAQYNDETIMGDYDIYVSGWTVRPNPDFLFGMNTCDSRPNADGSGATSIANYCSEEFDALYAEASVETDPDARAELLKDMQMDMEQAAIFPVFFYADKFQAYRSDRFENFAKQPTEGGAIIEQSGAWGLHTVTPVGADGAGGEDADAEGGIGTVWWIVIAVAVVLIIVAIVVAVRRRGSAAIEDRE